MDEEWRSLIPEGKTPVTHPYRPGWVGYVYEVPWGISTMADVLWVWASHPEDGTIPTLPSYPVRYSKQSLRRIKPCQN